MIEYLNGKVLSSSPMGLVLLVNGVGYGIRTPLNLKQEQPKEGNELSLWIHTRVREEEISLFGFQDLTSRRVFELLLLVSGVGPKVALAIMSTMTLRQLFSALKNEEVTYFQAVPGVGKKTAEKIIFELRNKSEITDLLAQNTQVTQPAARSSLFDTKLEDAFEHESKKSDLISALGNLGFKEKEIRQVIQELAPVAFAGSFQSLVRQALALLGRKAAPKAVEELF